MVLCCVEPFPTILKNGVVLWGDDMAPNWCGVVWCCPYPLALLLFKDLVAKGSLELL